MIWKTRKELPKYNYKFGVIPNYRKLGTMYMLKISVVLLVFLRYECYQLSQFEDQQSMPTMMQASDVPVKGLFFHPCEELVLEQPNSKAHLSPSSPFSPPIRLKDEITISYKTKQIQSQNKMKFQRF